MKATFLACVFTVFALFPADVSGEVRTWTSAADPTKTFEAEFRSVEGDIVNLVSRDGRLMPVRIDILSEADREYIKGRASGERMVPGGGAVAPLDDPDLEKAPMAKALGRNLVTLDGKTMRRHELVPAKYYLIYRAASWENRGFKGAPEMGKKFTEMVAANPLVEMIYVSHDRTEDGMKEMLTEFGVAIPAVRYEKREEIDELEEVKPERVTVPLLQLVDAQGELVASGDSVFEKLKDLK